MDRPVVQGLAVFRWVAWAWMAGVIAVSPGDLVRTWLAYTLVAVAFAFTVLCTSLYRARPELLLRPPMVLAELAVGVALLVGDGYVRPDGTVFSTGQSLGSVWPLTGVITAGVAFGPIGGGIAGAALGACRYLSTVVNDITDYGEGRGLSLASTAVFYAMAGAVFGYVYLLLQRAREEIAIARAREDIARRLHDGVLQTLAIVERRADDPALARLAREQERELREYLFGSKPPEEDLGAALRRVAGQFEERFGGRVEVVMPTEVVLEPARVEALAGAVGEALTNAGKHGQATRLVVFVDEAEGDEGYRVFCSVKDDGSGFDTSATPDGVGLAQSIRARITEVGGRAEVHSRPGHGTEVRLWLPNS